MEKTNFMNFVACAVEHRVLCFFISRKRSEPLTHSLMPLGAYDVDDEKGGVCPQQTDVHMSR